MSALGFAFAAVTWFIGLALIGRAHWLEDHRTDHPPTVSVIVPARNEATRLPRLLRALAGARPHELIVVDDGSRDATSAISTAFGAHVVAPGEPPAGWTGKAWACAAGGSIATGDVLVFLDADVEPTPSGLDALAGAASTSGGLVSAQPRHRVERLYERASAGPALVTLLGSGTGPVPACRRWRAPMAFGPAVAIRRELYHSIGGHAAVRSAVDDDLALARVAAEAGVPVVALLGGGMLGYRMYPDGPAQLVEGWTKNLASGARATPPARLAACVAWVTGALSVFIAFVAGPTLLVAAVYLAFAAEAFIVLRRAGRFGWMTSMLYPVALFVFVGLFAGSTVATAGRRRVRWRGREIAIGHSS